MTDEPLTILAAKQLVRDNGGLREGETLADAVTRLTSQVIIPMRTPEAISARLTEYRITFAVKYGAGLTQEQHPIAERLDSKGYVAIFAPDEETARLMAFNVFGETWSMIEVPGYYGDVKYNPMGELGRITIDFPLEQRGNR